MAKKSKKTKSSGATGMQMKKSDMPIESGMDKMMKKRIKPKKGK